MTFVAARTFPKRTLVISDTRLTDPSGSLRSGDGRHQIDNCIPGQVKIVPLNSRLSIAYAGSIIRALDAIRHVASSGHDDDVEVCNSLRLVSLNGDVEFLIVSHLSGSAKVIKAANGVLSLHQDIHWIGDPSVTALLTSEIFKTKEQGKPFRAKMFAQDPEDDQWEEWSFGRGWSNLLLQSPKLVPGVGGIPIVLNAIVAGHHYHISAGAVIGEDVSVYGDGRWVNSSGVAVEPLYGQYSYSIVTSGIDGTAVVGVWLQEIGTGYLYLPLDQDEPITLKGGSIDVLAAAVKENASRLAERNC